MPKFLYSGNYTAEGAAGLLSESGTARHEEAKKIASDFNAIFSIHAAETIFEQKDIKSRYGNTVIRHLDKLGLLDEKALLEPFA